MHAEDLRAEGADGYLIDPLKKDYRIAELDGPGRALLDYAVKLTRTPASMKESDVEALRAAGFPDGAIHDAAQIVGYFNYANRLVEGLGVDLEAEMPPRKRRV